MPGAQDDQQVTDDQSTDLSTESGDRPLEGVRDDSQPPTDNTSSADGLQADIDWQSSDVHVGNAIRRVLRKSWPITMSELRSAPSQLW